MSFVGDPFTHDIFVSYAHGDVRGVGDSNYKQWSASFYRELQREFEAHESLDKVSIFFDGGDRPSDRVGAFVPLDPLLQERVSNAAVFMPLISPPYLKSAYCMQELEWFREAQEKRAIKGHIAPIIIWGKPPEPSTDWKEVLKPLGLLDGVATYFFARDKAFIRPQPFGWPGGSGRIEDFRFYEPLIETVGNISLILADFKPLVDEWGRAHRADGRDGEGAAAKPNIYLHGRDDEPKAWDDAANALTKAGYPVTPFAPEPVVADAAQRDEIRKQRIDAMAASDALMVIGPQNSAVFSQELTVLGRSERNLAIDKAERELHQPGKRLPCAVIDSVSDPNLAMRRRAWAENNRLGWFELTDPAWVNRASEWLGAAMR